jgi:hypothetical protein
MSIFKEQLEKEFNATGIKRKSTKVVYSKKRQTGKRIDFEADKKRKALAPGLRISKSGKKYYEYRKNRTDLNLGI